MKLRVTVTFEFEPDPKAYDDTDPAAMAEVDRQNYHADPACLAADMADLGYEVRVEPIEEQK